MSDPINMDEQVVVVEAIPVVASDAVEAFTFEPHMVPPRREIRLQIAFIGLLTLLAVVLAIAVWGFAVLAFYGGTQ